MSILSGFLKTKRRRLTDEGYILQSEWASASSIEHADGKTTEEKVKEIENNLNTKISNTDVVDNLESTSTKLPLSANQGRLLGKQLGGLTLYAMSETDFTTVEEDTESGLYILYKEEESTE